MSADLTGQVLEEMKRHGLEPGSINWTGRIVRFSVDGSSRKKDGWYVAYPDAPQNVRFGDWKNGVDALWTASRDSNLSDHDAAELREEWAKAKRQREADIKASHDRAAVRYNRVWSNAPECHEHPYLTSKGVKGHGLRAVGKRLIVPMKSIVTGEVRSLQIITHDFKRFAKGGEVIGGYCLLGEAPTGKERILVAEGYATAATLHEATKLPVIVAFTAGNLLAVAKGIRAKCPDLKIVVCADNDRFTDQNPGRLKGQEAAYAVGGFLTFPPFPSGTPSGTDFNDLNDAELTSQCVEDAEYAGRAEDDAEEWPEGAPDAPPPPEPPDAATEPKKDKPKEDVFTDWRKDAPFRCLGYDDGTYFYLPKGTGQVTALPAGGHERNRFLTLAPLSWWESVFHAKWATATDALMRACESKGVFRSDKMRGRGVWPEEGGHLLHLGDRLLAPNARKFVDPEEYESPSGYTYDRLRRINGPSEIDALDVDSAARILDVFRDLLWKEEASGWLAAGWVVLAPICGALVWRPHIWVIGERGSGKSTIMRDLIAKLLTPGFHLYAEGQTTEAGIRQELRSDSIPVVFDEAEEDETAGRRIQAVLALARQSSSESDGRVLKGTVSGTALHFRVRSMFCLSSISGALQQESDKSRVCLLQLRGRSLSTPEERREHWTRYAPKLAEIDDALGRRLIARTLRLLRSGMIHETLKVFRTECGIQQGDQRLGDQFGTLYAGAYTLISDTPPTHDEAREIIRTEGDLASYIEDQRPDGLKVLDTILQARERVDTSKGSRMFAVGQLCERANAQNPDESDGLSPKAAAATLRQLGLKVEPGIDTYGVLLIANTSGWVTKQMEGTAYQRGWKDLLRTMEGVTNNKGVTVRFHAGLSARATSVPLRLLEGV